MWIRNGGRWSECRTATPFEYYNSIHLGFHWKDTSGRWRWKLHNVCAHLWEDCNILERILLLNCTCILEKECILGFLSPFLFFLDSGIISSNSKQRICLPRWTNFEYLRCSSGWKHKNMHFSSPNICLLPLSTVSLCAVRSYDWCCQHSVPCERASSTSKRKEKSPSCQPIN